jgi:hypothetical protein
MAEHLDNRELATQLTFEADASDVFDFLQRVDSLRIDMEWDDATTLRTLKKGLCLPLGTRYKSSTYAASGKEGNQ